MTSEVAIANKSAIAVAADSAITVGNTKVHRSANKIFSISDAEPLGLMVYGNGEFCGLPWETLAKLFRQKHGLIEFATVQECFDAFRSFLESAEFFTDREQKLNLMLFATDIVENVFGEVVGLPQRRISRAIANEIASQIERFDEGPDDGVRLRFSMPTLHQFRRNFSELVAAVCDEIFDEINYELPKALRTRFVELVWRGLGSNYRSRFAAGVGVFGFGEVELLPQLVVEEFDACCYGNLRSIDLQIPPINQQNSASIFPFADREVMHSFIEGVNRRTQFLYSVLAHQCMERLAERIVKDNFTLTSAEYAVVSDINGKIIRQVMDDFVEEIGTWIMLESIGQVVDVVAGMPKEEIAALAEALVEVTAARSKVVDAVESVGGDVDVCVVTKGDGLIWIKRKHYFDLEKNQQYLRRRFRSSEK